MRTLLKQGVLQPDLFDADLCEVEHDGKRLIVRRNDTVRVREERRRADKLQQLQEQIAARNAFVEKSARASAEKGLVALQNWAKRHKLAKFVTLTLEERVIVCAIDEDARAEDALLDGCYTLETDVPKALLDAKTVDERYRDLQHVERNFRTVKTTFLEIRPIFLRQAERTKAHVFVAMLALGRLTYLYTTDRNGERHVHLPRPDAHQAKILKALGLSFPTQAKERPAPSPAIRKKPVRKQNPVKQAA